MNREIKFRAKHIHGKWVYGWFFKDKDGRATIIEFDGDTCHMIDEETVGEFTGLKDRKGVKIFEGDIVRIKGLGEGIMIFDERKVRFMWEDNAKEKYGIENDDKFNEIIGNIYED